jgi:PadR family transcriptional regulator, regulatory protein AphA
MRVSISPEPALLGFLLEGPVHGYDLYKRLNRQLGLVWHVGLSQMYAIVKTFEARGWVRIRLRRQETRPAQKLLELTPDGRQAFDDWLHQPARGLREFRVDFFLRLFFARAAGTSFAQALVDGQIAACERELENLHRRRVEAGKGEDEFYRLTRSFRIQQLTTIIKWLEGHREQLVQPGPLAEKEESSTRGPGPNGPIAKAVRRTSSRAA